MKRKLTILALVVGMVGALLVTASIASGGVPGQRLDLVMNDTDGDKFTLGPAGGSPDYTQALSRSGCRVNDPDPSGHLLVELSAEANRNNPGPGLKDHILGVLAQGEGNGTPCARINGTQLDRGEILRIELAGLIIGHWYADQAQFGIKLKFGATGEIQAFKDGSEIGTPATFACLGSDCGPDSGDDRHLFELPAVGESYLFDAVEISVSSPADGSVSLLDDPGAGYDTYFTMATDSEAPVLSLIGGNPLIFIVGDEFIDPGADFRDNFDPDDIVYGTSTVPVDGGLVTTAGNYTITYEASDTSGNDAIRVVRDVIVYDGELDCGDTAEATNEAGFTSFIKRIFTSNDDVAAGCSGPPKPYTMDATTLFVSFDPFSPDITANYRGDIVFDSRSPSDPQPILQYDRDLDGPAPLVDMQACNLRPAAAIEEGLFPELAGPDPGVGDDLFPSLVGVIDTDLVQATWCLAAINTTSLGAGSVIDVYGSFGNDDPVFGIR
ncbi:MAG: DUF5011 domain-containing protein [Acidimicrobiia bacterium]|nr:DUF5011 domain-containing protein [Acidimicrobiia bacterium]MDH3399030.1 DUF5011 domain-containing protein [Acidimicrobiia bacterium]